MPDINYELIRSRRKTISITITQEAAVVVRAPLRVPKAEIAGFIREKSKWILEKQALVQKRAELHRPQELVNGEEFLYLGRRLMLAISDNVKAVEAVGETLAFPRARLAHAETAISRWYAGQAGRVIGERVKHYSALAGIPYLSVGITSARHRWGSCNARGRLNFTWRLVMAPVDVIDYVVVHELAHIEHLNHSSAFWARVAQIMPEYKEKLKWLNDNSALLKLF